MALHNELGRNGESLALEYLVKSGLEILDTNWRQGKAELDIIYMDMDTMVFVEVKTRSHDRRGKPEEAVHSKKQKLIASAASRYMAHVKHDWKIRFDIISIVYTSEDQFSIEHFKDAFFL